MTSQEIQTLINATPLTDGVPNGSTPIGGIISLQSGVIDCSTNSLNLYSGIEIRGHGRGTVLKGGGFPVVFMSSRNDNGFCSDVTIRDLTISGVDAPCIAIDYNKVSTLENLKIANVSFSGSDTNVVLIDNPSYGVYFDNVIASRVVTGFFQGNIRIASFTNCKFMRQNISESVNPIIDVSYPSAQVNLINTWLEGDGTLIKVCGTQGNPAELNIIGGWREPHRITSEPQIVATNAVVKADQLMFCSPISPVVLTDCFVNIGIAPASGLQLIRCKGTVGGKEIKVS